MTTPAPEVAAWDPTTIGIGVALLVGVITVLLVIYKLLLSDKPDTVLLVGLCDAGKTLILSRIAYSGADPQTYTSMQENELQLNVKGNIRKIIDFPGNDRLRGKLSENYLKSKSLMKVVFVVDSAAFSKKARDVAELFYDVVLTTSNKVPILVACHKQDLSLAKSEQVIRTTLEKEMGLINKSRSAALKDTDGSNSRNATLTGTGTSFSWSDLSNRSIDFALTAAHEGADVKLEAISSFVRE